MKHLEAFVKALKIEASVIEMLKKDELPEDFNLEAKASEFMKIRNQSAIDAVRKDIEKEAGAKAASILRKSGNARINKALGLGLTRSETDEMEADALLKLAIEANTSAITAASKGTDETLKAELSAKTQELVQLKEDIQRIKDEAGAEVAGMKQKYDEERSLFSAKQAFNKAFADLKITTAYSSEAIEVMKTDMFSRIYARYDIVDGKKLTMKDGSDAINFEENGKYGNLSEPVIYLANKLNLLQKSNGGSGGEKFVFSGMTTDNVPEHVKRKMELMRKQTNRQ